MTSPPTQISLRFLAHLPGTTSWETWTCIARMLTVNDFSPTSLFSEIDYPSHFHVDCVLFYSLAISELWLCPPGRVLGGPSSVSLSLGALLHPLLFFFLWLFCYLNPRRWNFLSPWLCVDSYDQRAAVGVAYLVLFSNPLLPSFPLEEDPDKIL